MAKTILVVMKLQKNVGLLLRRLENVVKPGHRIVFLFEYQYDDVPNWLLAHVTALQTGCDNGLAWQEQKAWFSWDERKAQAEEIVGAPARRTFSRLGVEVVVDLYSRSVSATVKRYLGNRRHRADPGDDFVLAEEVENRAH